MRGRHSRRRFLGVGLGCAAPLLLQTPLAEAASRAFAAGPQAASGNPILDHLLREAVRNYRGARAALQDGGRIPGEQLRVLAANAGLLEAYLAGRQDDVRLDEALRQRIRREGRDATVLALTDGYRKLRITVEGEQGIALPEEPDFVRAGAALDLLHRKGVKRLTRLFRQWAEWEAAQADRAAGRVTRAPAAWGQKPGDDFGGYPPPDFSGVSCDDVGVMLAAYALVATVLAAAGLGAAAAAIGIACATGELLLRIMCVPLNT